MSRLIVLLAIGYPANSNFKVINFQTTTFHFSKYTASFFALIDNKIIIRHGGLQLLPSARVQLEGNQ